MENLLAASIFVFCIASFFAAATVIAITIAAIYKIKSGDRRGIFEILDDF